MSLKKVEIESSNELGSLPVYVSDLNKKVGVIVIQEWWGVNEQIKSIAFKWFGNDYVTLVPDLYRGKVASDRETAGHYFKDLNWNGAIQDIQAAVNYLHANGVEKIGVTGFCMGGALSIASAVLVDGIHAAVPYYGVPNKSLADPGKSKIPLQLHFGLRDDAKGFSDVETQDHLENVLKENNINHEFYRYEAGHAFANESSPNFHKESAELAYNRTHDFFRKYLN